MGANEQQSFGSFTRVHDAGFGLVKDRAGVYAGEDRASSILNISTCEQLEQQVWKILAAGVSRI